MRQINECIRALRLAVPNCEIKTGEPLRFHTTFAIGGPADLFLVPHTAEDLTTVLAVLRERDVSFLLLGNGSNMLISDEGIRGAVVCTSELDSVRVHADGAVISEAGALLSRIARRAQRVGLSGVEFAGGIPGSLGGAIFMNAGAYDGQMAGIVTQTTYLDGAGTVQELVGAEHNFDYRQSIFRQHPDWTILRATLRLPQGDPAAILEKMNKFAQSRREKQPLNYPSAGSTFKRPTGCFAGQLIESAGLKGASVGAAQVSEKHAGFLINRGGASCSDMLKLIELVQQRVYAQFGVLLECEVRIIT